MSKRSTLGSKVLAALIVFMAFTLASSASAQVSVTATVGTVGPTAYTTLKDAFDAVNVGTHRGTIAISITGDTSEKDPAALNASGSGASSYIAISIKPSGGAARTISGALPTGSPLINLNGAANVSIDGLNSGGNALTIINTTVSAVAGTSTLQFINGATNNIVTNTTLRGSFTGAVSTEGGTVVFSTDVKTANGNDNNTISNNTFGAGTTALPTKGIHMVGSTTTPAINNSGNVITGNNFEDHFGEAVTSSAVYIGAGNTDVTISKNKFYQTASRTQTTGTQHSAIWIVNSGGNNFRISGNTIGFASSAGSGTYTLVGVADTKLVPIYLSVGSTAATSVQNNTIAGIAMSGTASGTFFRAPFMAIYVANGLTAIGNVIGNTIGSQSINSSISYTSTSNMESELFGLLNTSNDNSTISNNEIGGIISSNPSSSPSRILLIAINTPSTTSTASAIVQNNVIGGAVANSIQSPTTARNSQVVGLRIGLSNTTVIGNTIRNLTAAGGTGTTSAASVIGILTSASFSNYTLSQNSIFNLVNTNATGATTVSGIEFMAATSANLVERNFIYGLSSASTSANAQVNGIRVGGGASTYRNNMIAVGAGVASAMGSGSTVGGINGFNEAGGSNSFFHNSVYVGGAAAVGSGPSAAFSSSVTTNARSIRNNIFQNSRSNEGATGKHFALRVAGTAPNPTGLTINNNLYLANGTGGVFGFFNSADVASIAAWKVAVGQDVGSFAADPNYVNPTAATPDLHLQSATLTAAEGNGADLGVSDDFDGQARGSLTPHDIGADAGNFIGSDAVPPIISYEPLGNTFVVANRVLSVTLTDATAVATGAFAPRIYFSKNLGAYVSTPCVLASGTVKNGTWSCTIDHALLSGVVVGDGVKYFVVAQDTTARLGSNPDAGLVGIDVNTVSSPPSTPSQYGIGLAFSGSYNTGPGERFTSLTRAGAGGLFAAINAGALTGNVTVNITGDLLIEDGAVALNQWSEAGVGNYTLLIKPSGAARTIRGSAADSLIRLNDADRVTLDGSLTGATATGIGGNAALRQLTIANTNVGTSAVVLVLSGGVKGAQNNTFRNLNIVGQDTQTTIVGILLEPPVTELNRSYNDNNRIENCSVQKVIFGIYSAGQSATNPNTGTVMLRNDLSAISGNRVSRFGITLFNDDGAQISENSIGGIDTIGSSDVIGIALGTTRVYDGAVASGGVINANVSRNKINGVAASSGSSDRSAAGIAVAGGVGTNTLANNMISGVISIATTPFLAAGIFIAGATGSSTKLFHNSVAMTGARFLTASQTPSYAVAITGVDPTVELKNNIFYTTQDGALGGANAKAYAIGMATTKFANFNSNYNTFYSAGPTPGFFRSDSLGPALGTDYATLALWKTATSTDANSLAVDPLFVNPLSDLHLQAASPMLAQGTPIAGVTIDFDGQVRDTPPDMGADEITTATPPTVTTHPNNQSVAVGSTVTFAAAASGSPTPTVQWFVSSDGGATFTAISGATATTLSFTVALADHNKRYRATFTNSNGIANSTAATLAVLVALNINVPAGIQFSRDATVFTGSQTFSVAQSASFTLATTSPQNVAAGSRDAFVSWSDAGAISHTVTVNGPTTITASFTKQHQLTVSAGAGGSVTPASGTFFNAASVVPVIATANAGFGFVNWTGPVANATAASTTVTMSTPQTIAANFATQINGVCGSASGTVGAINAPSVASLLCSTGTPTAVTTNTNNFTWGCNGNAAGSSTLANACSKPRQYVVLGTAVGGGSIVCASPVNGGATTTCTLTPVSGAAVGSVSGCGAGTGTTTYTTGPISANCTVTATFVGTIPASERSVLIDLYNSTNGAGWTTKTNWLGAVGTECSWLGVFCDQNGTHVNRIALRSNNLTGTLPPLGALSSLYSFDASANRLTGSIPPFTGLSLLNVFRAAGNQLTGSIPSFAGITTLQFFDVSRNRLTGSIPALVGQNILSSFDVHSNQLTGPIPSLTGLSMLDFFYVNDNLLTGAVPDVPSPNALQAGNSSLCPNPLTISVNTAWDAATGATPWSAACASAQFTITPSVVGNGSISPSEPVTVPSSPRTIFRFTATPAPGRIAIYGGTCPLLSSTATTFDASPLSDCTVVVTFLEPGVLNIDASSAPAKYDPAIDGVMILRYLFGLSGDAITNGLIGVSATRTAQQTQDFLASIRPLLDVDGNQRFEPLTDGVMIVRYMMGLRMPLVTAGVLGTNATRTPAEIDAYLAGLMP